MIDKEERDQLFARWRKDRSSGEPDTDFDLPVAELIEEGCKALGSETVNDERCAAAGQSIGSAWRRHGLDPIDLVVELAAVRRAVWEALLASLRPGTEGADAIAAARSALDTLFDAALADALAACLGKATPRPEAVPHAVSEPARVNFDNSLQLALASAGDSPVALVFLHIEMEWDTQEAGASIADPVDVSQVLSVQRRRNDLAFRLSDSDFAIICPGTDADGARNLLGRISGALALYALQTDAQVDVTGGLAVAPHDGTTPVDLIRIALADREFSLPGGAQA